MAVAPQVQVNTFSPLHEIQPYIVTNVLRRSQTGPNLCHTSPLYSIGKSPPSCSVMTDSDPNLATSGQVHPSGRSGACQYRSHMDL
jgi:hypothetical protein